MSIDADKKQRDYQSKNLPNNLSKNRKLIHGVSKCSYMQRLQRNKTC